MAGVTRAMTAALKQASPDNENFMSIWKDCREQNQILIGFTRDLFYSEPRFPFALKTVTVSSQITYSPASTGIIAASVLSVSNLPP
jgi:hypothetical protein